MLKYKKGNRMFWTNLSDKFFIGKQKCCQTKPFSVEFMSNKFCCYLKFENNEILTMIAHSPYFERRGRSVSIIATKIFKISHSRRRLLEEMR